MLPICYFCSRRRLLAFRLKRVRPISGLTKRRLLMPWPRSKISCSPKPPNSQTDLSSYCLSFIQITGESYAGKYIPDITTLILGNNRDEKNKYINIKGIMVGNGVMSFIDNSLEKSSIDYMISHDTVSDRIRYIYQNACGKDFKSPRCRFAKYEIGYLKIFLNHYSTTS